VILVIEATNSERDTTPMMQAKTHKSLPKWVLGTTSPYPTKDVNYQ